MKIRMMNQVMTSLVVAGMMISLNGCGRVNSPVSAVMPSQPVYTQSATQQVLVTFKSSVTRQGIREFHAKYGTRTVQVLSPLNTHVVELDRTVGIQAVQLVKYLQKDALVAHVELNHGIQADMPITVKPIF